MDDETFWSLEFEALLYIAPRASEIQTGREWDGDTAVSYETYSNAEQWRCLIVQQRRDLLTRPDVVADTCRHRPERDRGSLARH